MWKKIGIAAAALVVALILIGVVIPMAIWPNINDVETGHTPEYPDVQPQSYALEAGEVGEAAVDAVDDLNLWELEETDEAPGQIDATRETRIFGFVDDVTIWVDEEDGVSEVNVRSRSRTGEFDYGQNARNIGEFFEALDNRIGDDRIDD